MRLIDLTKWDLQLHVQAPHFCRRWNSRTHRFPPPAHMLAILMPMIGLLQRVSHAEVRVEDQDRGLHPGGPAGPGRRRARRYGAAGRPAAGAAADLPGISRRRGAHESQPAGHRPAGCCWCPQFTLAADTRKGTRPGFSPAAEPQEGKRLFDYLVAAGTRAASRCPNRRVRRAHAGDADQRRSGHVLAAGRRNVGLKAVADVDARRWLRNRRPQAIWRIIRRLM